MSQDKKHSSSSSIDLDLINTDTEDHSSLAGQIESYYKADNSIKVRLSWSWERTHLFLDGNQWIIYDGDPETGGSWKKLSISKKNEYVPRPTTNYIFDAYQTLKSYVVKDKPRITVYPNTRTYKDKTAAKLSTMVSESNYSRLKEDYNYEYAASVLLTYGTVFKKSYWDNTSISMAKVPVTEEAPIFDPNTGQVVGYEEREVSDPETGEQLFEELPLGDVNTAVVEPYRIALDPLATDLHTARWIMEYSIQPIDWIKQTYGKEGEGYTGKVDEVKQEKSLSSSLRKFYNLKTSSGIAERTRITTSTGSDEMIDNAAIVKEYYERPSAQHPKGRLIVVANGIVLYAGESPYEGTDMGDWHPYSECRWEIVPGRFWGKAPLEDAIDLQKRINSIDSIINLTRKTMAIPQKLIPAGSGIETGTWTGEPGQEISYRATGGVRPEIVPPSGVHESVFVERSQIVEDIKQITGAIDILKGEKPPGVTAHRAMAMLFEVGTGKLFPALNRWKQFIETDQKKQLKIVAKNYTEPRPDFIKVMKSKNKELTDEQIEHFIGEDLHDNINVQIEAGSHIPKLKSAQQAYLMELAGMGVLNLEQPQNRMEFLQRMGVIGFDHDIGLDVKRARWENDQLDGIELNPENSEKVIVLETDDHEVHIAEHSARTKEPSFMALPFEIQQQYFMHIMEHQQKIHEAKMQEVMQMMAQGQHPNQMPADQSALQEQQLNNRGSGTTREIKNQLFTDTQVPGEGEV